jgi:hypothetical protein
MISMSMKKIGPVHLNIMCGGKNIRCRKEDKLPREMQRGAYKTRSSNG